MRLSEFEIETIKSLAKLHFGSNVQVFLFGSRTKNQLRGGDIDLFIRKQEGEPLKIRTKIDFITDLILRIGEQKIDVVLENPVTKDSNFFKTIYKNSQIREVKQDSIISYLANTLRIHINNWFYIAEF